MNDFDEIIDRRNTNSLKWGKYRNKDIIPLWVADMDFRTSQAVINALQKRIEHGVFGYTKVPHELNEAVQEYIEREYYWKISTQWIVWIPGVVPGLNISCKAIGKQGDYVIINPPVYPPFFTAPGNNDRQLIQVPLINNNNDWTLDYDKIEDKMRSRTGLYMLCNPHNPVGKVFSKDELSRVAEISVRNGYVICSDEIHNGLVLDKEKKHFCIASLNKDVEDRTITLMAPSKTYNIPGLDCSFAIIPNDTIRKGFMQAAAGIVPQVNLFGYTAAIAAYKDSEEWRRNLLEYLRKNRDLIYTTFNQLPNISVSKIEATYLAWIDCTKIGVDDPVSFFELGGVGLSNGVDFGAPGCVRLNFGCTNALLKTALDRMVDSIRKLA